MVTPGTARTSFASDVLGCHRRRVRIHARELHEKYVWPFKEVPKLLEVADGFDWTEPERIGISVTAWEGFKRLGLHPLLVFAHPRVLSEQPRLLFYYRTIALLSQGELCSLVGSDVSCIESGKVEWPERTQVRELAIAVNCAMSVVVELVGDLLASDFRAWQLTAVGAAIHAESAPRRTRKLWVRPRSSQARR